MQDGIKLRVFLFGAGFLVITAVLLLIIITGREKPAAADFSAGQHASGVA